MVMVAWRHVSMVMVAQGLAAAPLPKEPESISHKGVNDNPKGGAQGGASAEPRRKPAASQRALVSTKALGGKKGHSGDGLIGGVAPTKLGPPTPAEPGMQSNAVEAVTSVDLPAPKSLPIPKDLPRPDQPDGELARVKAELARVKAELTQAEAERTSLARRLALRRRPRLNAESAVTMPNAAVRTARAARADAPPLRRSANARPDPPPIREPDARMVTIRDNVSVPLDRWTSDEEAATIAADMLSIDPTQYDGRHEELVEACIQKLCEHGIIVWPPASSAPSSGAVDGSAAALPQAAINRVDDVRVREVSIDLSRPLAASGEDHFEPTTSSWDA